MRPQIDNILLIEPDGARQALLLMALLEAFPDTEVEPVATSVEALCAVRTERTAAASAPFDCVLLSGDLPNTAPADMARQLRASGVSCPLIVLCEANKIDDAETPVEISGYLPWDSALDGRLLESRIVEAITDAPMIASMADRIMQNAMRTSAWGHIDPLTGLADRGALRRYLTAHGDEGSDQAPWGFITVDVDGLGATNRRHGFEVGDEMLCVIARQLQGLAAPGDFVGRHRSDEFLIIKPDHDLGSTMRWAASLQNQLQGASTSASSGCLPVRASIGVVVAFDSASASKTIHRSWQAALCAKRCSGSRIATWSMVQFEQTAPAGRKAATESFEQSLERFLGAWQGRIGPTQSNHLTTHAEFVSSMAVRLGEAMGLPSEDLQRLRRAGLCHDIGKFLVPERILSKRERLTQDERGLLSRHAPDGADMARLLGADARTADFVRHHHARFDDARCDDRIKNVPLGAHIICVADAFVTMTSHRPYKDTRTFADAVRELQRESGRQFAPTVVDALPLALLAEPREESIPKSC